MIIGTKGGIPLSLIIAKKVNNNIYILGDTRLTKYDKKEPVTKGVIKSLIVNSQLCVSFAGRIDYAISAVKELLSIKKYEEEYLIELFLKHHNCSNRETDFIVALGRPHIKIITIKDGNKTYGNNAWIGDYDAFNKFQGYFTRQLNLTPLPQNVMNIQVNEMSHYDESEMYSKMFNSLNEVNNDVAIQYVGDFIAPIIYDQEGFHFADYTNIITHPLDFSLIPLGSAIPFGNVEQGGYSISFTKSLHNDIPIVVIYILQAKLGIIFMSTDNGILEPNIYRNVTSLEFIKHVNTDFNIEIYTMFP